MECGRAPHRAGSLIESIKPVERERNCCGVAVITSVVRQRSRSVRSRTRELVLLHNRHRTTPPLHGFPVDISVLGAGATRSPAAPAGGEAGITGTATRQWSPVGLFNCNTPVRGMSSITAMIYDSKMLAFMVCAGRQSRGWPGRLAATAVVETQKGTSL